MKKSIIIFIVVSVTIVLMGCVTFLYILWQSSCNGLGIHAEKVTDIPDTYINMSEQQMAYFPHLKEAILLNKSMITPEEEYDRLWSFLEDYDRYIKYQDEYYYIGFWTI